MELTQAAALLREATTDDADPIKRELMMELIRETYPEVWNGIVNVIDSLDTAEEERIRQERLDRLETMFEGSPFPPIRYEDEVLVSARTFEVTTGKMTEPGEAPEMTSDGRPWGEVYPQWAPPTTKVVEPGWYIVFEGIDGSGKTTQAESIAEDLDAELFREPGGTPLGEAVRSILKDETIAMSPTTEVLLFAAARVELLLRIEEIRSTGKNVVCDRSVFSSLAYQTGRGGIEIDEVLQANCLIPSIPDAVILLDLSPEEALLRTGGARDAMEKRVSLDKVRNRYLAMAHSAVDLEFLNRVPWDIVHTDGMSIPAVTDYIHAVLAANGIS